MMRYTHFVFDIDNTLINTTGAVLHGLQRALRDITGEHWDLSRLTPVLGIPGLDAFECLGIHSPEQIFQIYPRWEQYEQEYQYTAYLYEGIVPLLDFLKKKGCGLGIITSKTMPQYTSSFLPFQISEYFQTVITADDTVRHKPDPEPMLAYMERTGVCPRQILYIGDSIYDMQCAAQAGVDSCLALWGCHCPDGISSTHRFEEPAAMMRWLK
ncbi:HAD family hydrolase [Enterocloster bolteae]|nr:HAD family hydrolase [Enterocloster bolteae]MCB6801172.1 HAD family hydrolase [Enterocloster bolteae]MCB7233517.1 HAD family hydrolase [Enterocloster bolteae]MCG4945968.1 HAD family hydrolase [Enterocloster bolteae]MCG4952894.1 HAD family hydrolase [Enterocloster bolteae]